MSTLFNDSKYTVWYYSIINNIRKISRKRYNKKSPYYVYYERHHVIPKSLGGTNNDDNLVLLTAKEHMICHLLLTQMCLDSSNERKMISAYYKMGCDSNGQRLSIRDYKRIRERRSELGHSEETKHKMRIAWLTRPPISTESRKKQSETAKRNGLCKGTVTDDHKRKISIANSNPSKETRDKMSKAQKGKVVSEETREKLRQINLGNKHTEESILKMSLAKLGKTKSEETRKKMSKPKSPETREKMRLAQARRKEEKLRNKQVGHKM